MLPIEIDQNRNQEHFKKAKSRKFVEEIFIKRIGMNTETKAVVVSDTVTVYPDKECKCVTANVLAILV